jgi:hypothetical protein
VSTRSVISLLAGAGLFEDLAFGGLREGLAEVDAAAGDGPVAIVFLRVLLSRPGGVGPAGRVQVTVYLHGEPVVNARIGAA